jgi:hypothetical protein
MAAASARSSSWARPTTEASHATAAPAADTPASTRKPPSAPRDTCATSTGAELGAAQLTVVPHDTVGDCVVAPTPSASQARSPAPITTRAPAQTSRASPTTAAAGTTGGSNGP